MSNTRSFSAARRDEKTHGKKKTPPVLWRWKSLMHIQSMNTTLSKWKNTSVSMFFSTSIHPVLGNAILELLMCFLSTAVLHIHTVTHLGLSSSYTAAAGGGVPCSRVLDGSFKRKRRKWHLFPFHVRFSKWTSTYVRTDSHLSPSRDSFFSPPLLSKLITAVLK